jgi:hypothetical protein
MLTELAELCKNAGAMSASVFYSKDKFVVFYNDPHSIGFEQCDGFDELHIQHQKDACILIAVFVEDGV